MADDTILSTRGLSKEFKGFVAVKDVSLSIRRGTIHALIGPNGAGKTTCFNLLTHFLTPTRGQIFYNGREVTGSRPAAIARMGLVRSFQFPQCSRTRRRSKRSDRPPHGRPLVRLLLGFQHLRGCGQGARAARCRGLSQFAHRTRASSPAAQTRARDRHAALSPTASCWTSLRRAWRTDVERIAALISGSPRPHRC
jgi:energy-coupling factor transporter ATP-binding protein EcfA2